MEPQGWDALGAPQPASPAPAAAGLDKWPCRLQISCLVGNLQNGCFSSSAFEPGPLQCQGSLPCPPHHSHPPALY